MGFEKVTVRVANTGDRPIQVGSHYHFFETNAALRFDRARTRGFRLDIPAGTAVRFEPGQERDVELVNYQGAQQGVRLSRPRDGQAMSRIDRRAYAEMFGPTVGDRVRLADTELWIEIERDSHDLRRGSEVRRRQGHPRRHGPEPGDVGRSRRTPSSPTR